MKIIRNFLIGAGVIFLLIIAAVMFLFGTSSKFLTQHEDFVIQFTHDLSQHWEVADVRERCTKDFLAQINTPDGVRAIHSFSQLGKLLDSSDFSMYSYSSNTRSPTVGVIEFKAKFENAQATVIVTLHESSGVTKVHAFRITGVSHFHRHRNIQV